MHAVKFKRFGKKSLRNMRDDGDYEEEKDDNDNDDNSDNNNNNNNNNNLEVIFFRRDKYVPKLVFDSNLFLFGL